MWRIPNLGRSTVFHRPNQTSTPSPPVGNKRPAVYAPDAGGAGLQPRPLGTMSGGEGQAGWACELASQKEIISKQRNVQSQRRLWVWVGGRRNAPSLARSATTSPHGFVKLALCVCLLLIPCTFYVKTTTTTT